MSGGWSSPFPAWVGFCALDEGVLESDTAHPLELAELSAKAVAKRRRDFTLGRIAARGALVALGREPSPVRIGASREPLWPAGVVGAITHSTGQAAAAVTEAHTSAGIGLDLEDSRAITSGIEGMVTDERERAWTLGDPIRVASLFSAKESVFKAFFGMRGVYFGFDAVQLRWLGAGFEATLLEAMAPDWPVGSRVEIRCDRRGPLVSTSLLLPAP